MGITMAWRTYKYKRKKQKIRIMVCRHCHIKIVVPFHLTRKRCGDCKRWMDSRIEYRDFNPDEVAYDGTGTIEKRFGVKKDRGGRFRDQVKKR